MNTTTREGFLMNTLRRIPRHMVKALAAGAVLIAAALPMAFASAASAAAAPVITGAFVTGSNLTTGTTTISDTAGTATATINATTVVTYAAGDLVAVGNVVIGTLATSLTTASGANTATLVAGASTTEATQTVLIYAPVSFGEGTLATPSITVLGTGFAADGGKVSLASSDPDLSFTFGTNPESASTILTAVVASTAVGTMTGPQSITLTDDNGTSNALAGAITVNADPTVSAISPATLADSQVSGLITVTGNFVGTAATETVALTDAANNTALEVAALPADLGGTNGTGTYVSGDQGIPTSVTATSITFYASALNDVTHGAATAGAYSLTVTNADGGPVTAASDFTVTAAGITNISPSAMAISTTAETLQINGFGFQPLPTVALSGTGCAASASLVASTTNEISPSVITIEVTSTSTVGQCTVTVTNNGTGDNGAVFVATSALGIGEAGFANATVTAASVSPSAAIVPGTTTATPVTLTVTGTGFSSYSTVAVLTGTGSTVATGVTASPCVSSLNGDSLTCTVAVGSGASASTDGIEVNSGLTTSTTGTSGPFEGALSVSGPAITSASPAALAVGAPEGTVVTFTGTGFNSTATATATGSGLTSGDYVFAETSPTTATLTLTAPLPVGSNSIVVTLSETVATGITVTAAPFTLKVDAKPTVSALVNTATKVDAVGAGAVNVSVTITGTGFATGATITKLVSAYGVADTGASGSVVSVNSAGTQIIADITLPVADANLSDGYTITNTDGGTATAAAFTAAGITIDAGPTITSVSPAAATANSTAAFTITGTGFVAGAVVSASQPDATCGAATVVSATSITVSCTFLAASTTATSLVVTNPDGGSATSAAVLAAGTTTVAGPKVPHATHVHGSAVTGKTVTITISGTGFYGAPKITSNAKGTTAKVTHDTGKLLTVRISTKAGKGTHTLTIRDADGKSCKINYSTK
jgi:hypothetical protein